MKKYISEIKINIPYYNFVKSIDPFDHLIQTTIPHLNSIDR